MRALFLTFVVLSMVQMGTFAQTEASPAESAASKGSTAAQFQGMTPDRMYEIFKIFDSKVQRSGPVMQFTAGRVPMACVYDQSANRMRIVAPIQEVSKLKKGQMESMLKANYHSALDVRYAISDDIVYVAYIHPLAELHDEELQSAVIQVANAALTFGSYYTSTEMSFGGRQVRDPEEATGKGNLRGEEAP